MSLLKRYFFLLLLFSNGCLAVALSGDSQTAAHIRAFIKTLDSYYKRFDRLLKSKTELDARKDSLLRENRRLSREQFELKLARHKLAGGTLSQADYDKAWRKSGREKKFDADMMVFRQSVSAFNRALQDYNNQARGLMAFLKHRHIGNLKAMMREMRKLRERLADALDDGNSYKAEYIASESRLARELGYRPKKF